VRNILKDDGLFSFRVSSAENYINKDLKFFLQSLYATLKKIFKEIKVIPGDTLIFLASNQERLLTYDYKIFEKRAEQRNLDIKYVRDYYLFSKLSPQRINYIEKILKDDNPAAINYDFRPRSYFYATIFWLSYFRDSIFSALLKSVNTAIIWVIFFIIIFFIFLIGVKASYNKNIKNIIALAILVTGFSQMSLQIIILLSFQLIYGYLFYHLGFLLTAFMAGLSLGALLIIRISPQLRNATKTFIYTQAAIFIYCLLLPLFLKFLSISSGAPVGSFGANILFPLAAQLSGFIAGMQFPLANKIYLKGSNNIALAAGLLYGLDLCGACLGAFLVSIFLIPLLGITSTSYLLGILNFSVILILLILRI
jgi:spermidine synthase